jgi:hypothetical protein
MELLLVFWVVCGVIGAVIAQSKNRSSLTGGLIGLIGGPVGVLIVACERKLAAGEVERTGLSKPVRYLAIGAGVLVAAAVTLAFVAS